MLTKLSLFSGIGGDDLASEWAGIKTVAFVERDKFCQQVLKRHWPEIPVIEDIHDVNRNSFRDSTGTDTVDIIAGGFPCQPFSTAGQRRGTEDDRYLWPEMFRVIREVKPRWVVGENVAGIVSMALDAVLSDMEGFGYQCQTFRIPACGVGAWHRRDRIFIVCHSEYDGRASSDFAGSPRTRSINCPTGTLETEQPARSDSEWRALADCQSPRLERSEPTRDSRTGRLPTELRQDVSDSNGRRCQQCDSGIRGIPEPYADYWSVEPNVGRVAHGVPRRVDRLRALGNAVVPQQIYPIYQAIVELEVVL